MTSRRVSDFTLEQFLLDELPPADRRRVEQLLSEDGELRTRLEALQSDTDQFAGVRSQAVLDRARQTPDARRGASRSVSWKAAVPLGLGVAALVLLVPLAWGPSGSDTRIKGGAALDPLPHGFPISPALKQEAGIAVFAHQDGRTVQLADGTGVRQGDQVQLAVSIGRNRRALLLSIDGSGHLTLHAPDSLKALLVGDGDPKLLPFAYQLDDAPDFERFVLVTGAETFDAQGVWNSIAAQTSAWLPDHAGQPPALRLSSGLTVTTFDLRKMKENS